MLINGNLDVLGFIRGLRPDTRPSDPEGAELLESLVWVNSTEGVVKWYDGTKVQVLLNTEELVNYVSRSGSTMTGPLTLSGDAESELDAVPLQQLEDGLGTKENSLTGAATTVAHTDLAVSKVVVSNAEGKIAASGITTAELDFLDGVNANIQEQLDGKEPSLGYTPVNVDGDTMKGDLQFGGMYTATNLCKPTRPTDAVRLVDIDNIQANLDFQPDVLGKVEAEEVENPFTPVTVPPQGMSVVRYIVPVAADLPVAFGEIEGLADNDIIEYNADTEVWSVAYAVAERGAGALVWNRGAGRWEKFDGSSWNEHGGLSGVTVSSGLEKEGNTIAVKFGGGTTTSASGGVGLDLAKGKGLALIDGEGNVSGDDDAKLSIVLSQSGGLDVGAQGIGVTAKGIVASMLGDNILGFGLQGANGEPIAIKLDGSSLVVDNNGLRLGDVSDEYVSRSAETSSITGQLSVPAPTGNNSVANKKYVDDVDTSLQTNINSLDSRVSACQVVFDGTQGSESDIYAVVHNMNNKFVSVAVYDIDDSMIIPDSVVLTDKNTVTVTLELPQKVRIVVTGNKHVA